MSKTKSRKKAVSKKKSYPKIDPDPLNLRGKESFTYAVDINKPNLEDAFAISLLTYIYGDIISFVYVNIGLGERGNPEICPGCGEHLQDGRNFLVDTSRESDGSNLLWLWSVVGKTAIAKYLDRKTECKEVSACYEYVMEWWESHTGEVGGEAPCSLNTSWGRNRHKIPQNCANTEIWALMVKQCLIWIEHHLANAHRYQSERATSSSNARLIKEECEIYDG